MVYHAKEHILQTEGFQMRYLTFGCGAQPLVLIQGLNTRGIEGAADGLAWMYRIFAKNYQVYLFDRRADISADITIRELAADTACAMDALGISSADVIGVSQGGMIAQYLAIDRPDLVRRMVLAVTAGRSNPTLERVIGTWISLAEQGKMKELVTDMAEKMYSPAYLKRYRPFLPLLTMVQKPKNVQRFVRLAKSCLTCSACEEAERIKCPVLLLGGAQDQIVTGAASLELAECLRCEQYLYPDLGHAAYEEAADFNGRMLQFLQRAE